MKVPEPYPIPSDTKTSCSSVIKSLLMPSFASEATLQSVCVSDSQTHFCGEISMWPAQECSTYSVLTCTQTSMSPSWNSETVTKTYRRGQAPPLPEIKPGYIGPVVSITEVIPSSRYV